MAKFPGHFMNVAHKLDLSANQIRSLPWSTLKKVRESGERERERGRGERGGGRERGWERDPSDNQMAKFPGHLMNVAHKLDLSANQIRSLPWSTLKKVRERGGGGERGTERDIEGEGEREGEGEGERGG